MPNLTVKSVSSGKSSWLPKSRTKLLALAVATCFAANSYALPTNPTIANGSAGFAKNGNVLTVTNSNGAIINWQSFSIGASETTRFIQTSASSAVLNRVLSSDPSLIYGTLTSNGRVWLVNPAGIMVGAGGRVDTAGFVASTLNIRNEDFLAGRKLFESTPGAGSVVNQGSITTPSGGTVYLIGPNVTNEGIITTPQGETILAAGQTVSLLDTATPGVKVDITGAEGNVTNLGTVIAEAGRIGMAGVLVKNSGTLNASSVVSEGGRIFLRASRDAYVDGNGRIVTTGTKGGSVEVLGNRVAVMDNAEIDASGTNGGGKIMVGGDYQGKNPDVQNANITYFGPNATLKADAKEVGDGGTVIVWADDTTRAYGSISARGGSLGGNGGLVETSGKRYLDTPGIRVDVGAENGTGGVWLLDPSAINIVASGTSTTAYGSDEFSYGGSIGTLVDDDINAALIGGASIIVRTDGAVAGTGDITASNVAISGPGSLTLAAYGGGSATGNIVINGGSLINLGGSFKALAGWNGATTYFGSDVNPGTGDINIAASNIQSGLNMDLHAGRDIILGTDTVNGLGTWVQSQGLMSVSARQDLKLLGGSVTLSNISSSQGPGVMLLGNNGQTVNVDNQILLQAGSANNTVYGDNPFASGSVAIQSGGNQDISAKFIKVYAGASGHDNSAQIQAHGSQTITITGTFGLLDVKGGGDASTSVYGGAGSFNNQARILHGTYDNYGGNVVYGSGVQTITLGGSGGTINVAAGSGTGVLGYYGSDCRAATGGSTACRGGSNSAEIENLIGSQALAFGANGSLTVTGGNAGTKNWAGIENKGSSQAINGNPNIILTGGTSGGSALNAGAENFELSNDAGIYSKGTGGQYITAGTLTINGGDATYGGAGISNEGPTLQPLQIVTSGDLSMYGGTSNASHPYGAAVYIHSEYGGPITLDVGGNLYVKAGTGTSTPAIIGSVDGPGNVSIVTGGNVDIIADKSGVAIGSISAVYGATVGINSGGSLTISGSATRGVLIGSKSGPGVGTIPGNGIAIGLGSQLTANSSLNLLSQADMYLAIGVPVTTYGGDIILSAVNNIYGGGILNTTPLTPGAKGGGITVTGTSITLGNLTAIGADGSSGAKNGGYGGTVTLTASAGNISAGAIDAHGGNGYAGGTGSDDGNGGNGGNVMVAATGGTVILASVKAHGGDGRNGGQGSSYYAGGDGGNGGAGGTVGVTGTTISITGGITSYGGNAGAGGSTGTGYAAGRGGKGGIGGNVTLTATQAALGTLISVGDIDAHGGGGGSNGGNGRWYDNGNIAGRGGYGGAVTLDAAPAGGSGGIILAGKIDTHGGAASILDGGEGAVGGIGGDAGAITLSAYGGITLSGGISAYGGDGGGAGYAFYPTCCGNGHDGLAGGEGGKGGKVKITSHGGAINITASGIDVHGGKGGGGGDGVGSYGNIGGAGGVGGYGGTVLLTATVGNVSVTGGIDVSGGKGGTGGKGGLGSNNGTGGRGGSGGWGGSGSGVTLVAGSDITLNGTIFAYGANGGAGGTGGQGYYAGGGGDAGGGGNGGSVTMTAGGGIKITGDIATNGGNSRYGGPAGTGYGGSVGWGDSGGNGGYVSLTANGVHAVSGKAISVTGIDAHGGHGYGTDSGGGNGGDVTLVSNSTSITGTAIAVTSIDTRGGNDYGGSSGGGRGGDVNITTASGGVTITSISTRGGDAFASGSGGSGGNVTVSATNGNIAIDQIDARGGNGNNGGGHGSDGGSGGTVVLTTVNTGNITVSSINTSGGNGGSDGSSGGSVFLTTDTGNIKAITIDTHGGNGSTSYGRPAGDVTLTTKVSGDITVGTVSAYGGSGPGRGGDGGTVSMTAGGGISVGTIDTHGGNASGSSNSGGRGGDVSLTANGIHAVTGKAISVTSIDTHGGDENDYDGTQDGGNVMLVSNSTGVSLTGTAIAITSINTRGGNDVGSSSAGHGGNVSITTASGGVTVTSIDTRGGNAAGDSWGGDGGNVTISATNGNIAIDQIDTRGGNGGTGGVGIGRGGSGGGVSLTTTYGGNVSVGSIYVAGGAGGTSGSAGYIDINAYGNISLKQVGDIASTATISASSTAGDIAIDATGNVMIDGGYFSAGSTLISASGQMSLTGNIGVYGSLALVGSSVVSNSPITANASQNILVIAGTIIPGALNLSGGAMISAGYNLGVIAGAVNLSGGGTLEAGNEIAIAANSLRLTGSGATSPYQTSNSHIWGYADKVTVTVGSDITLDNGAFIGAGTDVRLALNGADSLLTLNPAAGGRPSYIWANSPRTIYLAFPMLASGGVVIDGVQTLETVAGGSGLFVGPDMTPAKEGFGLSLAYQPTRADSTVTADLLRAISATNPETTPVTAESGVQSDDPRRLAGYTTGGTSNQFGDEENKDEKDKDKDKNVGNGGDKPPPDKGKQRVVTCS